MSLEKEFDDIIAMLGRRHNKSTVFYDFCHMSALALAQQIYDDDTLEQQYMDHVKKYTKEEANEIARLLTLTHKAYYENPSQDFLGERFMANELYNNKTGQFFTPYFLSLFMAKMQFGGTLPARGYITLAEPAAGAGGMVIAFANVMQEYGFKPTEQLLAVTTDIDSLCFSMCYIQLSLCGIPALVQHGDSLRQVFWKEFLTPSLAAQFDKFEGFFKGEKNTEDMTEMQATEVVTIPEQTKNSIVVEKSRGKAKVGQYGLF